MQKSKLGLDFTKVAHAKDVARNIAVDVQSFVEQYTTVAVERTLCRLLGIDGVDENTVPLPNVLVSSLQEKGVLGQGILFYLGN
ncbi:MAG TPA: D-lysine 5,6-aminomutase subunit alpha, partial [Porphyromonadaceae bacterium]|nr:D-lysine 5,6-aminomutase subunit alpha [Porphyromonadaceae bacterium]